MLTAMPALRLVTAAERPELAERMLSLGASPWPEFLNHDAVVEAYWRYLYELAPNYQFALLDEGSESLVAIGNCIPIRWDGNPHSLPDAGIDAVLEDGIDCLREGATPTAASALMIVVSPEWLGRGISAEAIGAMAGIVGRHGLTELVAPVRPTYKHRYPLIPIERYIRWRREDGLPLDPWIRVHERVGGGRSLGPPRPQCASPAPSSSGSAGLGSRCRKAAPTSFQVRSCPFRSTASATWASTRSRPAGCATASRAPERTPARGLGRRRQPPLLPCQPLFVLRQRVRRKASALPSISALPLRPLSAAPARRPPGVDNCAHARRSPRHAVPLIRAISRTSLL